MKKLMIAALLLAGCNSGVAGSGTMKTENRSLGNVTEVSVEGIYQVKLHAGAGKTSFSMEGDDNLLPLVLTDVTGTKLQIHSVESLHPSKPIAIQLEVPALARLAVTGVADVDGSGIRGDSLNVDASGVGKLMLAGDVKTLTVSLTGASQLKAQDLHAESVHLNVAGSGNASVFASKDLDVTLAGAGNVDYYGKPANVKKSIAGAGSLNPK